MNRDQTVAVAPNKAMHFQLTPIAGVFEVKADWYHDNRGTFGRVFCQREFAAQGLSPMPVQSNLSTNPRRGTVRGLHIQARPHEEAKLVCCVAGKIFDVALDLRPQSATYGRYHAVELDRHSGRMLFLPEGCAHGYQTLEDDSTVIYHVSAFHNPAAERGVRWNDPMIGIPWPISTEAIVSERDRHLPSFEDYQTQTA